MPPSRGVGTLLKVGEGHSEKGHCFVLQGHQNRDTHDNKGHFPD